MALLSSGLRPSAHHAAHLQRAALPTKGQGGGSGLGQHPLAAEPLRQTQISDASEISQRAPLSSLRDEVGDAAQSRLAGAV